MRRFGRDLGVEGRVSSIGSDAEATPIVAEILSLSLAGVDVVAEVRLASPSLMESWQYVAYGTRPSEPEGRTSAARLVDTKRVMLQGKELVPGVILRPETKARDQEHARLLPAGTRGLLMSRPLTIQFTGEYHLFPTSSGQVQSDSVVYSGTPLDAAYINMGGGSMETEAYQPLHPPIDFTNCAEARTYAAKWRAIAIIRDGIFEFEQAN